MDKKPGLMIAVLEGLKKKGKVDKSSDMEDNETSSESEAYREHLEDISKELITAVEEKDHLAVADLLEEAFLCLESQPHSEESEPDKKLDRY